MKTYIKVSNVKEGYHFYKDAPEEVSFLRNTHRHLFKVYSTIEVFSNDRELEFFCVQREIDKLLTTLFDTNTNNSCEFMCMYLIENLQLKYGTHRRYIIEVSEDGENSAIVDTEISTVTSEKV